MADGNQTKKPHVIIVGAGVVGLLIAQGLKKAGHNFTIFEAEAQNAVRRDWGLSLHWGRKFLKDLLPVELFDQLQSTQVNPFYDTPEHEVLPIINGQSGELITKLEFGTNYRISRKRLRELFARNIEIQHDKLLVGVEQSNDQVTVSFKDGTQAKGDILIGCDGARSIVRDFLFGSNQAKVKTLPYEAYFANPTYPADVARQLCAMHPIHVTAIHPDGLFCWLGPLHVPDPEKPETWKFVLAISGPKDKAGTGADYTGVPETEDRRALLKGNVDRFAEPYRTALSLLAADEPVWYIDLSQWETEPWDNRNGTVTLAGDAAHPMTFHRGQGLNNAILDAVNFVKVIDQVCSGQESLREITTRYDREVQDRGREEVISSYKNTQMLLDWDAFRKSPLFTTGLKREKEEAK